MNPIGLLIDVLHMPWQLDFDGSGLAMPPLGDNVSPVNFEICASPEPTFYESCSLDEFTRVIPSVPVDIGSEGCLGVLDDLKIVAHSVFNLLSTFVAGKDVGSSCRPEA
jgi:hypothetical protein